MRYKNTDAVPIKEERDLVEVVRCKECKRRHTIDCAMWLECYECGRKWDWCKDDDYCSYGERRDK